MPGYILRDVFMVMCDQSLLCVIFQVGQDRGIDPALPIDEIDITRWQSILLHM